MLPVWIVKLALLIIIARCGYLAISLLNQFPAQLLELLFYLSVCVVAIAYYLEHFHSFI